MCTHVESRLKTKSNEDEAKTGRLFAAEACLAAVKFIRRVLLCFLFRSPASLLVAGTARRPAGWPAERTQQQSIQQIAKGCLLLCRCSASSGKRAAAGCNSDDRAANPVVNLNLPLLAFKFDSQHWPAGSHSETSATLKLGSIRRPFLASCGRCVSVYPKSP